MPAEYLQQIEDCEARESRLSDWELNFISSLSSQVGRGKTPTEKQLETLDNIWEKATSKG